MGTEILPGSASGGAGTPTMSNAGSGALYYLVMLRGASIECWAITTVRLNVEQNQLVNVFGEFCIGVGSLKSA
jgi:hypothetical protein